MDKLKEKFHNDPAFALGVIIIGAATSTALLNSIAKNVTAVAYAYRASKV
ncbi:hypothetical protein SEA_DIZZYRUDY_32 [Microbacterium phage DizzyRudy]|nr:hypothetical protein SEA_DIZZYRUDY_32 [Microbacterium phage DizzyRudy]WMI34470.1 membrane protein [Microbacterium phage Damascus]